MIRINLLADRQAKDRLVIQQQLVLGVFVILAAFVLCGFWFQVKAVQISDTNKKIDQAKKDLEKQKTILKKVEKLEKTEKQVNAMLKAIESLMEVKRGPTIYFDNLNVILPPEIWMTSLQDNRGAIVIQGYSFSNNAIAQLMKNMEKSEHFVGVNLRGINKTKFGSETLKKFTINCMTTLGQKLAEERRKREAAKLAEKQKGKKR